MKTYLKLAALAILLLMPASTYAADPIGALIDQGRAALPEPQRIDPVEFFDKRTGKPKVWYWRAESGYEFYDAPGFHPRTGEILSGVTREVIAEWLRSQKNLVQCYIIQRDPRAPVLYRDYLPGVDPETGRECRLELHEMRQLTDVELDAVGAGQQGQVGTGLVVVGAQIGDITVTDVLSHNAVLNNSLNGVTVQVPIGVAVAVLSGATGVAQRLGL
jgi:hypothetical protein